MEKESQLLVTFIKLAVFAFCFQGMSIVKLNYQLSAKNIITSGVFSFKCNAGTSGILGFPLDLQPVPCEDRVVNCAKITGSKALVIT
jgi:hypothetical protein